VFRILKLAVYGLIGYMLYQLYQGLTGASSSGSRGQRGERGRDETPAGEMDRSLRPGVGTMTGPAQGQRVQTEDASGTGGTHVVGRGVV